MAFAVRDTCCAAEILQPAGFRFFQAPLALRPSRLARPPANFAEILLGEGWGDGKTLLGLLNGWWSLLSLLRPDVVLADHAPTALLAAHFDGIPHVAIGNGFAIPPMNSPLPSIRPWEAVSNERLQTADRRLQKAIRNAAQAMEFLEPIGLHNLYGQNSLLDTFPELDHYGERSDGRYIGPIYGVADGMSLRWQSARKKILVYVRPELPGFSVLMNALAGIDAEKICFIPGLRTTDAKRLANNQTRIALKPVALGPLLETADLLVCQGGGGVIAEALLAGTPLLIVPAQVEQLLASIAVERIGAGVGMGEKRTLQAFKEPLDALLDTDNYRRAAQQFARNRRDYMPQNAVMATVVALESAAVRDTAEQNINKPTMMPR